MRVQFTPAGAVVKTQRDGQECERLVSTVEIANLISDNVIETGLLPPNTRYWKPINNGFQLVVEVAAQRHNIVIKHDHYDMNRTTMEIKDVPLPGAVFVFRVVKNTDGTLNLNRGWVYAAKASIGSLQDKLWLYPAPNVQGGQTVCWGFDHLAANVQKYLSLAGFEGAISQFFRAGFNDHCFAKERLAPCFDWSKIKNYRAVEEYFQQLADVGVFKPEWLQPAGKTLEQAITEAV